MTFDFSLKTGDGTISGSVSKNYDNNFEAYLSQRGFEISILDRSGTNDIIASLNSQTIVERDPTFIQTNFDKVYTSDGDYFFKDESITEINFDESLNIQSLQEKNLFFDLRPTQKIAIGTGLNSGQMTSSMQADLSSKMPNFTGDLRKLSFFLNGQKIYSGDSYYLVSTTGFRYNENITGKIFAFPKKINSFEKTGIFADIYNIKYIENESNLYINGMEASKKEWLEISTGVNLIATGLRHLTFESGPTKEYFEL